MKEFKMKAWLKKEKKMVAIIGIDFNYEYIRYTEDDNLFCYKHSGFWQCMDTKRDMDHLNEMWEKKEAPWKVW